MASCSRMICAVVGWASAEVGPEAAAAGAWGALCGCVPGGGVEGVGGGGALGGGGGGGGAVAGGAAGVLWPAPPPGPAAEACAGGPSDQRLCLWRGGAAAPPAAPPCAASPAPAPIGCGATRLNSFSFDALAASSSASLCCRAASFLIPAWKGLLKEAGCTPEEAGGNGGGALGGGGGAAAAPPRAPSDADAAAEP